MNSPGRRKARAPARAKERTAKFMKKRILCAALAGMMAMSMAACSNGNSAESSTPPQWGK